MPIAAPEFNSAPSGQPRRLRRWLHLHGPHQSAGDGPGVVPRAREFPENTCTPRHLTKSGVQVGPNTVAAHMQSAPDIFVPDLQRSGASPRNSHAGETS